jgi:hypothetical protein
MILIYYSYFCMLVVGLILFTNFVFKFRVLGTHRVLVWIHAWTEVYFGSEFRFGFQVSGPRLLDPELPDPIDILRATPTS